MGWMMYQGNPFPFHDLQCPYRVVRSIPPRSMPPKATEGLRCDQLQKVAIQISMLRSVAHRC